MGKYRHRHRTWEWRSSDGDRPVQTFTVYATAPSANFTPDDYADTVTVNVNY
jgi:spore coat protein U-like protein